MQRGAAYAAVEAASPWSDWRPFAMGVDDVPKLPGVYQFRVAGDIVYVGMAGERRGSGSTPMGLRGRLRSYWSGRAATSGFGEAAFDRALQDPAWHQARRTSHPAGKPARVQDWARDAIAHHAPDVRWTTSSDRAEARQLESLVIGMLDGHGLWNRAALRLVVPVPDDDEDAAPKEALPPPADATAFVMRGFSIDLERLYREMYERSLSQPSGGRVYPGGSERAPAVKWLLAELFGVPVRSTSHPINHAIRSECRDRMRSLGWATKGPGRSPRYVLHREI